MGSNTYFIHIRNITTNIYKTIFFLKILQKLIDLKKNLNTYLTIYVENRHTNPISMKFSRISSYSYDMSVKHNIIFNTILYYHFSCYGDL